MVQRLFILKEDLQHLYLEFDWFPELEADLESWVMGQDYSRKKARKDDG